MTMHKELNDAQVKNAVLRCYKDDKGNDVDLGTQLTDGKGLYCKFFFDGNTIVRKSWRFDYTRPHTTQAKAKNGLSAAGKRNTLVFGDYTGDKDGVSLKEARQKAADARELLKQEPPIDPADHRDAGKVVE